MNISKLLSCILKLPRRLSTLPNPIPIVSLCLLVVSCNIVPVKQLADNFSAIEIKQREHTLPKSSKRLGNHKNAIASSHKSHTGPIQKHSLQEHSLQKQSLQKQPEELSVKEHCGIENTSGNIYRKRVAILDMPLMHRHDALDIPLVEREYPQQLVQRINQQGKLMAIDATHYPHFQPYPKNQRLSAPVSHESIRTIATENKAQFVVTGKLTDLSFKQSKSRLLNLFNQEGWTELKQQIYEKNTHTQQRQLGMEINIYDGPSGALLKQKTYRGAGNHTIDPTRPYGLKHNKFWGSQFGKLIAKTLDEQTGLINKTLACIPLRASVAYVEGDTIEIDAGLDANIMPGDKLRLFHKESNGSRPNNAIKYRWKYAGEVSIIGVYPLKSIAKLDERTPVGLIQKNDIVQAW